MVTLTIDEEKCKGCGLCIEVCPKKILVLSDEKINQQGYHPVTVTDLHSCVACASCAKICPVIVFTIEK